MAVFSSPFSSLTSPQMNLQPMRVCQGAEKILSAAALAKLNSLPCLDDRLQREGQGIQVLRLHIGAQHTRSVLEELLSNGRNGRGEAQALNGALASMMVTRKWLARSRPAASPEKLPPITSTRRLDRRECKHVQAICWPGQFWASHQPTRNSCNNLQQWSD